MSMANDPRKKYYGPRRGDGMGEWMEEDGGQGHRPEPASAHSPESASDDDRLPTIALLRVPHPTIMNLYQQCFDYVEPWSWSAETERVETGKWFFARPGESETVAEGDES